MWERIHASADSHTRSGVEEIERRSALLYTRSKLMVVVDHVMCGESITVVPVAHRACLE